MTATAVLDGRGDLVMITRLSPAIVVLTKAAPVWLNDTNIRKYRRRKGVAMLLRLFTRTP